ncbi:MAG: Holliday junction branch migration protein RuvA [Lachnospiraceae bacterium]|nr:Holliday junction branch migration protein RuvA [Lachnospiraceae bacterium]
MYAYLNGILADAETDNLIIDVNGVGYNVHVYDSRAMFLPAIGSEIKVYTYTSVGEDKFILFGFLSKEELDLFKILISVNGVGPKSAQAMLSALGINEIRRAIVEEDAKTISKTPGLGAKTAGRLINDLKDKITTYDITATGKNTAKSSADSDLSVLTKEQAECVTALVNLGYQRPNAKKAVEMVENFADLSTEDLLKAALKNVMFL